MALRKFTMKFELSTIEHLGVKLYASLPRVVGELVSNAWDADSPSVEITLPEGSITDLSEVKVRDYGTGMNEDDVQDAYLRIGRNRRDETNRTTTTKGRHLTGRKGLGKLSAFGIADEILVRTIQSGSAICIKLDYERMKHWPAGKEYEPEVVEAQCGPTVDRNGTEILIRKLRRRRTIDVVAVRKELARRFTSIDDAFRVFVNKAPVTPADRRLRESCKRAWDVTELPGKGSVDAGCGWTVTGWIGLVEKSSQVERGVDVFAWGKAVELETMFGLSTTHIQFARSYVVGEVHADFLDDKEDNISTARNGALWESDAGAKLQEWGQKALTFVFSEWLALQRAEKQKRIVRTADFETWLGTRSKREQAVALKLVSAIVSDDRIEPEAAAPLLEVIKANVEFTAFQELVDEIEDSQTDVTTLLRLVHEWEIIEAREHLKLSDGRLDIMKKLAEYVKSDALEVQQIQPLFERNGWLVDTGFGEVTGQTRYTDLLRRHCPEPKGLPDSDRRVDILGYYVSGSLLIVELKRPGKTLSRSDLDQIEEYVDWARTNLMGTGENSPAFIRGRLIVGHLSKDGAIQKKAERLAGSDIRVETYDDLLTRAETVYGEVERRLRQIAPEYSRTARRARKERP